MTIALRHVSTMAVQGCESLKILDLDMVPKALLITKIYLRLSTFYNKAHALYLRAAKKPRKKGWRLPIQWWLGGGRVTPIYSMRIIDEFQAEVENAKPGDMFLIHLFLPHYPYAYDAECNLKDPDEYLHAPAISTQYQGIKSA